MSRPSISAGSTHHTSLDSPLVRDSPPTGRARKQIENEAPGLARHPVLAATQAGLGRKLIAYDWCVASRTMSGLIRPSSAEKGTVATARPQPYANR
jgi:hypothetical protein